MYVKILQTILFMPVTLDPTGKGIVVTWDPTGNYYSSDV